MSRKKWRVSALDKELASDIAEEYDIDPFCSLLLVSRGITDDSEIFDFFSKECRLSSPFEIKDMDKAVERIRRAIEQKEKILIYGDYDADGVTSTALLYLYLKSENADVSTYIPDRNSEGYGLNLDAVKEISENGVKLIITVDNGISAFSEAEYISALGMDLVITDHHKASENIPQAVAVVDPHRYDCPSDFKLWAGVGVAFKLVCALSDKTTEELLDLYSDLVTIGTIGDIVSLTGENRAIVKHGLKLLNNTHRPGIKALKKISGVDGKEINASTVAYSLVPRINAIGRITTAEEAFRLLVSESDSKAMPYAQMVDSSNVTRQDIEKLISGEAEVQIRNNPDMLHDRVLIFSGKDWHGGVIGIVAARLTQKYGKPCLVITDNGKEAKGSGRSIEGFSLYDAISSASHLLNHFGGHTLAAGFGMDSENLPAFKKAVQDYAKTVDMPFATVDLDCRLKPEFISADVLDVISQLEPFGAGNPQPLFGLFGMTLSSVQPIGSGKHIRLSLKRGNATVTALYFGVTVNDFPYNEGDIVDLAVRLEKNEYMGQVKVSVYVKDIRMSGTDDEKYLKSVRLYEKLKRKEKLSDKQIDFITPTRQNIADVFRFLRSNRGWKHDIDVLCYRLSSDGSDACRVLTAIDVLEELGIVRKNGNEILLADTEQKVNLEDSKLLSYLRSVRE